MCSSCARSALRRVRPPDAAAGLAGGDGQGAQERGGLPAHLASKRSFGAVCIAAQDVWVLAPRWSRTIATASRWVSPEPAVNA